MEAWSSSLVMGPLATAPLSEEPMARAVVEGDTDGAGNLAEQEGEGQDWRWWWETGRRRGGWATYSWEGLGLRSSRPSSTSVLQLGQRHKSCGVEARERSARGQVLAAVSP